MADQDTVSRPRKLEHLDTIFYEADMLDYCYGRLRERRWRDKEDYYLCIEGFLLHYRNLIEFFGNKKDLRAGEPQFWAPRKLTSEELASIQDSKPFKRHAGQISQYLSHCTKSRAARDRDWRHIEMYEEVRPLLANFRRLFPSMRRDSREVLVSSDAGVSTATITYYDVDPLVGSPIPPGLKDKD